jgi:peptide/nickel transport system ATP-binding protein
MRAPLLDVQGLSVRLPTPTGSREVVSDVSFAVAAGEALGIVGESGSGKTLSLLALLRLLPTGAVAQARRALYDGQDLLQVPTAQLQRIRGRHIACVFQDSLTALNPVLDIGAQLTEVSRLHLGLSAADAREQARGLLARVGIPDPMLRLGQYPHEFSGGMRQRVCIAMALAGEPRVLIADEPTTALDVTVQAEIVQLVQQLQRDMGLTVIWVTHDLALLARIADRVIVLNGGRVIEDAPVRALFLTPRHDYTAALVRAARHEAVSRPAAAQAAAASREAAAPLVHTRGLTVSYGRRGLLARTRRPAVQALRGVDLDIRRGEVLAIVGESGSGKSTLARALVRAINASSGTVTFDGTDITLLRGAALRRIRRHFQVVAQDPFGSLNPQHTIGAAIAEPLIVHGLARGAALQARIAECLTLVGLDPGVATRRPHEFSGGQRQRICIARAIAAQPQLIVADEALSALDPSLRDRILDLFQDLKERLGLTYLFISHDLDVVRRIADRVAVMYLGRIVEIGPAAEVCSRPRHPYTQALMAAVPVADPAGERARTYTRLPGEPPSPARPPAGCAFHPRCARAVARCRVESPALTDHAGGHPVACHLPD